jgi:hypothetical protein
MAALLGVDATHVTRSRMEATVKELANVACGATVNTWMPFADFHFSVPGSLDGVSLDAVFAHGFAERDRKTELAIEISCREPV